MNIRSSIFLLVLCALPIAFVGAGCKKKDAGLGPVDVSGVKVDMPKLQQTFADAKPELMAPMNETSSNLRYGFYDKAVASLEKLAAMPDLNAQQKKVVNEVLEQMKQVVAKAGPTRQ